MPQLNPTPWFFTLMMFWFILFILLKPSLLQVNHTAPPNQLTYKYKPHHWPWLWQ